MSETAPADPVKQADPEQQPPPPKPEDFDKLRSQKDKEIGDLRSQLSGLQDIVKKGEAERQQGLVLAGVSAELEKIGDDDPAAVAKLKDLVQRLGGTLSQAQTAVRIEAAHAKEQTTRAMALELVQEYGGDYEALRTELAKAESLEQMNITKDRLALRLEREGKPAPSGVVRVDKGAGRAVQNSVLDDMRNIDVTTPEGQAEWAKRSQEFRKKIEANATR